jgi:hypothetical protein
VSAVIEAIRAGRATLDESARVLAESGRLPDVGTLLAAFARLEPDHMFNLIYRGQLQTVLILSRALELSWPTVDAMLAVRAAKQRAPYRSDPAVRRDYEAVDLAVAQRTIRFLRVRQVATAQAGQPLRAGAA